jgi:hypothetical protein
MIGVDVFSTIAGDNISDMTQQSTTQIAVDNVMYVNITTQ